MSDIIIHRYEAGKPYAIILKLQQASRVVPSSALLNFWSLMTLPGNISWTLVSQLQKPSLLQRGAVVLTCLFSRAPASRL